MLDINLPYHQLLPHLGGVKCVLDCSETKAVWHGDERQNLSNKTHNFEEIIQAT